MSTSDDIAAVAQVWQRQLDPPPTVSGGVNEPLKGDATWLVDLATVNTWLPLILPGSLETVSVAGVSATRYVALQHPNYPNLYAKRFRMRHQYGDYDTGSVSITSTGDEALCYILVEFESLPYPVTGSDAYLSVRGDGYTKEFPVEATFAAGGTPAYDAVKPVSGELLTITVHDSPNITAAQEAAWVLAQNSLNLTSFRENAPGYVKFLKPTFEYLTKFDGTRTCNYSLQFDACQVPHNKEYTRAGTLDDLWVNGAVRYPSIEFADLFK